MYSASRTLPEDIRATFVRILAYMGGLAVLAVVAASYFEPVRQTVPAPPPPAPIWTAVERPYPAFELLMPELSDSAFNYAILRRSRDGARKDVLTWGDPAAGKPYAMVEVFRPGPQGENFLDAPSEIAARIIDFAVTDDVKPAGQIDSKFGSVPLVDFAVAPHGRERRCLGFAQVYDSPAMQLAGWYCSAGEEVVDRAMLACMLDRLTLVIGDADLGAFFAHAEVKRKFCGQRSPILAATPEREDHIAPRQAAKLKAALRGRLPSR